MRQRQTERVEIPGVGAVDVPIFPEQDDFPNLHLTQEEICFKLFDLERRIRAIEAERQNDD